MTSQELVDLAVGLESTVWQALMDGDRVADEALLAEDFVGVYPTGFANRSDHSEQLIAGPTVADFSILNPSVKEVTEDCLLLSYETRYRRTSAGSVERMYVSSLWGQGQPTMAERLQPGHPGGRLDWPIERWSPSH